MKFDMTPLPYAANALEPHISERTVLIHYEKHHQGYLKKLDAALPAGDARREWSLERIIAESEGKVFNCAAQVWNHDFYWRSLDPSGQTKPSDALRAQINSDFDSQLLLQKQLKSAAAGEFGSGWAWLAWDPAESKLKVNSTTDAENPLLEKLTPLLTIDVWEHAYYLDYQNLRGSYLEAVVDNALNWNFASENFATVTT